MSISSVEKFISRVKASTIVDNKSITVYRGHCDRDNFTLSPSVLRQTSYRRDERNIIREIVALHPLEFSDDETTLERLVRMQHFSLPTRLLDVTHNPLVALYFACKFKPKKPAEVISFRIAKRRVKYFDSDTASCIANLANLSTSERKALRGISEMKQLNETPEAKRLLHFIRAEKPYFLPRIEPSDLRSVIFVKPKQSNRRIVAQQGAFLLFGLRDRLDDGNEFDIEIGRISIPASRKQYLLSDLDKISINASTLFPEIEAAAGYLMTKLAPDT